MSDQASPPSLEERTTTALESIASAITQLLNRAPPQPRETLPPDKPPTDAHYVYLSGQWKRRDGHNHYDTPVSKERSVGSPPIGTQLDPWIRRDVPAIDEDSFGPGPTRPIDS